MRRPHLTPEEIVDRLDGRLAPGRAAHLDACDACRASLADAQAALDALPTDLVPEPSPLFWTHSARRVREAIDAAPAARRPWGGQLAWAAGGLAAAAVAVVLLVDRPGDRPPPSAPVASHGVPAAAPANLAGDDTADDGPWALVAALGGELDVEAATRSGLVPPGDLADRALLALDEAERSELAALLTTELRRPEI
jgi:hypothetical protein